MSLSPYFSLFISVPTELCLSILWCSLKRLKMHTVLEVKFFQLLSLLNRVLDVPPWTKQEIASTCGPSSLWQAIRKECTYWHSMVKAKLTTNHFLVVSNTTCGSDEKQFRYFKCYARLTVQTTNETQKNPWLKSDRLIFDQLLLKWHSIFNINHLKLVKLIIIR